MSGTLAGIRFGVESGSSWNETDRRIEYDHSATYVVQMTSESEREPDVLAVTGVPSIGTESPLYAGAWCRSLSVSEVGPLVWEVEASFDDKKGEKPDDQEPWDRLPKWGWSTEVIEVPMLYDAVNVQNAIQNSCGDPLPPVTTPRSIPVLTITRKELTFDGLTVDLWTNKTNSTAFWGAGVGEALLSTITANKTKIKETELWEVAYQIKFKTDDDAWKMKILDQGLRHWKGPSHNTRVPFGDDAFQQVIGNLDGNGEENTTNTPHFLTFHKYGEADLNTLDLGPW